MATLANCANCLKQLSTDEERVTRISCLNPATKTKQGQGQGQENVQVVEGGQIQKPGSFHHENVVGPHHETLELSVVTLSQTGELFQVDVEEAQQLIDSGVLRIEGIDSTSEPQQHIIELSHTAGESPGQKDERGQPGHVEGVTIADALSVIFGIPLNPVVASTAENEASSPAFAWRKDDNCGLCIKCGQVVRTLYSAFQEFNSLTVEESYVARGIKQFLNKINSLNMLNLQGQLPVDQGTPAGSADQNDAVQRATPLKAKKTYNKKSNKEHKKKASDKKKMASTIPPETEGVKSRKKIKLEKEDSENENDGRRIRIDNISELSSDSNSLSDLEKEVTAETEEAVRKTRTSTRRRVAKKQLSDYEELESSEEEEVPEPFEEDDEEDDPNFDAEEEIQDMKVSQEDVQLRQVSDICVEVLEYKEEDLQVDSDGKFICPECKKTYIGLKRLNKHVLIHKLKKAPNCPKCNIKFETLDELHRHMTSIHGSSSKVKRLPGRPPLRRKNTKQGKLKERRQGRSQIYSCLTCDEEFANQSLLTQHETEHGPVPCPTCHKEFTSQSVLLRHAKDVHEKKEITHFCPECGEIFNSLEPLSTHFYESHNANLNFCTECGKSFVKSKYLFQHLKETHQTPAENIQADQLSENDDEEEDETDQDPLREPGERMKKSDPTPYKCPHCDKEYRRKKQLDIHILFHNGEEPQHECNYCTKRFFQLKGLKRHLLLHTSDKAHNCEQCDRVFSNAENLNRHMEASHSAEKSHPRPKKSKKGSSSSPSKDSNEHKCSDCDKTFTRKEYLRLHQRIHTGEKPFMCSECGKTFRDPRNLAQHLVTHNTARPFCCSICGLTFKRAHHLNDHEGTHREDVVRPFVCSLANCGKAFKLKKHLISHELVHSGTKDHQCEVCGKAFNRKDNLRQHVNKVHGKESNFSDLIRVPKNENEVHLVQVETPTATLVPVSSITDNSSSTITTIQILPAAHFTYTHL